MGSRAAAKAACGRPVVGFPNNEPQLYGAAFGAWFMANVREVAAGRLSSSRRIAIITGDTALLGSL
jgi:hypothetical protein